MADSQTRELLPEVQAYITAKDEAESASREAEQALTAKYRDAFIYTSHDDYYGAEKAAQRREHSHEMDAAYQACRVATNEAWNKLGQSSDPLVRFIAENCKEYQGYAIQVLKLLPATLDELERLADNEEWCDIWGQFRDRAVEAGVMPGIKPMSPARKAVLDGIDEVSCCRLSGADRRRVSKLLDALVAEATEVKAA